METFSGNIQINHYDAEGLHHEMEENGKLVTFIYRGDEAIAEESQEDKIRYIRTSVLLASDAESARTYYHYASDEMSSITHVVGENEEILNHYEYDAWGNLTVCEEKVQNRFRFNGQQYDPISQQYYLRARYYNPVIGRFTQEDSYNVDGLNLYAYCRNNPVSYVDPSGNICGRRANTLMDNVLSGKALTRKERRQLSARLRDEARNGTISDKGRNVARQMGIDINLPRNRQDAQSNITVTIRNDVNSDRDEISLSTIDSEDSKEELDSYKVYYHVTTQENAEKIISSGKLGKANNSWECRVFAWNQQPTKKQASIAGIGKEAQTVIRFSTNASFELDKGNADKKIGKIVVQTTDGQRIPISIKDAEIVGFKKAWWERWIK